MTLPTVTPSLSPEPDLIRSGSDPSGSGAGVSLVGRETASAGAEWSEERDRELAARAFVNHAADIALRQSLGALCKSCVCGVCGVTFVSASAKDSLCHVCVSETLGRRVQPMDCDEGEFEAIGDRAACLGCTSTVGQPHEQDCPEVEAMALSSTFPCRGCAAERVKMQDDFCGNCLSDAIDNARYQDDDMREQYR